MRIPFLSFAAIGATAAALSIPAATTAEDEVPRWQQARVVGEAENCIQHRQIRNTRIRDRRTIDFHMTGGRMYRNTLPHSCAGLSRDDAFSYRTSISTLCSSDIITVLEQPISSSIPGPRCGLGDFVPIELPERG